MERGRTVSDASDTVPLNPTGADDDLPQGYNDGDISMHTIDSQSYPSPVAASPKTIDAKGGAYAPISTPTSTFDEEHGHHAHPLHVKRFDYNESRKKLLLAGASRLLITIFFSVAMCVTLKSWEGWGGKIVLSKQNIKLFNSLTIGLSLCLGLNILASLKHYAATFRWAFLTRRYMSLEVFDLILHLSSLAKVTKLMIISSPGFRGKTWLRKFRPFRDVRDDGTKWMWLACLLWLVLNISSQVLVAVLSIFWPMSNSYLPLLTKGNVTVVNMNTWYVGDTPPKELADGRMPNETALEAAWTYGMEAMVYPVFDQGNEQTDLSSLPGLPLYNETGSYSYRFYNRDSMHLYTNYLVSSRNVSAVTTCDQLEVHGDGYAEDDSLYIEGKEPGKDWSNYTVLELAPGSISWTASVDAHCGPRCTNFTVIQYRFPDQGNKTSLFLCNSTLGEVSRISAKDDITTRTEADKAAVYGNDDFARIAAGAIGWTGLPWAGTSHLQVRTYSKGSKWSPANVVSKDEVEKLLMRFTIGAVAAFDHHGIPYNMTNQDVVPTQGQQLDVDWSYIFSILGGICGIQFVALCLLVMFANRTIVRDDSYFSIAMLLTPVVNRLGHKGMNMSGEEIKEHRKLKFQKIRYDYREGKNGEPNKVDIFFQGKDKKEGRKSWAQGSYS